MVEGVSSFTAISSLTGKMSGRSGEPDCQITAHPHVTIPSRRIQEDNVPLSSQELLPLTDKKSSKNVQFQDCAFPVLCQLVSRILQDQHTASRINDGALEAIVMDEITPENAKALVANDGHWHPDQTAARIIYFALTISGNNPKNFDKIKESINSGFSLAGESFGGELPEICSRTYNAMMNGLDQWVANPDSFE